MAGASLLICAILASRVTASAKSDLPRPAPPPPLIVRMQRAVELSSDSFVFEKAVKDLIALIHGDTEVRGAPPPAATGVASLQSTEKPTAMAAGFRGSVVFDFAPPSRDNNARATDAAHGRHTDEKKKEEEEEEEEEEEKDDSRENQGLVGVHEINRTEETGDEEVYFASDGV